MSESSVGPALLETFSRCEGRIIVTCFASNVHRVQQVVDAADALGRKVALVGRSMRKNFNIASNLGIANAPEGLLIQPREIEDYPDEEVVAISTGSQGEPLSALRRMAHGEHRDVQLHSGDTVVFSATPVPGNERSVNETIDRIFEIGARVITAADAPIHASGHGYQEDMKLMLNLTRPKYVMPMHGDFKRIRLHAMLAESVGVDPDRIFRTRNGVPLEIDAKGARLGDDIGAGMIFVDGLELGEPDDAALRDRRTLSADGLVIVVATVSIEDSEVAADPEISFRGVPMQSERRQRAPPRRARRRRRGQARGRPPRPRPRARHDPPGRPRRGRDLRLQAPEAPPDGPAGRHRGLGAGRAAGWSRGRWADGGCWLRKEESGTPSPWTAAFRVWAVFDAGWDVFGPRHRSVADFDA